MVKQPIPKPTNRTMNTPTLKQTLDNKGYTYTEVDGKIIVTSRGSVYLRSLTTLPEGTSFNNQGSVDLSSLTTLPEGISFNNKGCVDFSSLTTLPEGISFNNQGSVYLRSLTTLPEGIIFNNQGDVGLSSLTTLPEGISFNNKGYVDLRSLTTLPEGIIFNNQGDVYLSSLTNEVQIYQGEQITFRHIDDYTMLIESEKLIKGITVCRARYFGGGKIKALKKCYVAKVGNHWAHGKTAKEAIQDATDKATLDADVADVVAEIKLTGRVTVVQYRAITGACREGCRQFLHSIGKPDATDLPLVEVILHVKGHYGFDKFIEATTNQPTEQ